MGPTVLEVFNTLLKHLRVSVDGELADGRRVSNCSVSSSRARDRESVSSLRARDRDSVSSSRARDSDERIVQNAIIQTIGSCTHTHTQDRKSVV